MSYQGFTIEPSKYQKNSGHLNLRLWGQELSHRWEILEFKLERYGYDHTWNLIKKHGFLSKIHEINGQLKKGDRKQTEIGKRMFADYGGLNPNDRSSVHSITTYELKQLCQHRTVRSLFQRIDGINGASYESRMGNMPDLNEPVNLALDRNHNPTYHHLDVIDHFDHVAVRQYVGVSLDKPEEDLVNDFRQWLKSARAVFSNKSATEVTNSLDGRITKLKSATNSSSLDDLESLKRDTLTYNLFPYLDVKIDILLGGKKRTLAEIAKEAGISDDVARKYTRPLIRGLMNETVLRQIMTTALFESEY